MCVQTSCPNLPLARVKNLLVGLATGSPPHIASLFPSCWDFESVVTGRVWRHAALVALLHWEATSKTHQLHPVGADPLGEEPSTSTQQPSALEMVMFLPRSCRHSYLVASHHPIPVSNQASPPRGAASALPVTLTPFAKALLCWL